MRWFETLIEWLFPTILLDGTPWKGMWEEKDRESFVTISRFLYPSLAFAYVAHFFFYDLANSLEPIGNWFLFRAFIASVAMMTFAFYMSSWTRFGWYRFPAILASWIICQSQAFVALWYGLESWVFCYILVLGAVLGLRMSALKSLSFVIFTISTQAIILVQAAIPITYVFTGSVVCIVMTLIVRASYLSEVRTFRLNQENILAQKHIIELNIEFADRVRSFIPKVIAQRLEDYVDKARMSVIEASIEVLAPKKKKVACLFSDIRGFTQGSKNLEEFIAQSVMPEVKQCSDAVESFGGIPRKIGDLIFAYFDEISMQSNLLCAVASGIEIARRNYDMNATSTSVEIRRYVLISCGEALVGNLGGLDSSIEITALGSPVNFLSRLDEATKNAKLAPHLRPGDLLLCNESSAQLKLVVPGLIQRRIDLRELGVTIRDFPEVDHLYCVSPSDHNYSNIMAAIETHDAKSNGSGGNDNFFAAQCG